MNQTYEPKTCYQCRGKDYTCGGYDAINGNPECLKYMAVMNDVQQLKMGIFSDLRFNPKDISDIVLSDYDDVPGVQ